MKHAFTLFVIGAAGLIALDSSTASAKDPFEWGYIIAPFSCRPVGGYGQSTQHVLLSTSFSYCRADTSLDGLIALAQEQIDANAKCASGDTVRLSAYADGAHGTKEITDKIRTQTAAREAGFGKVVDSFYWAPVSYSDKCK